MEVEIIQAIEQLGSTFVWCTIAICICVIIS